MKTHKIGELTFGKFKTEIYATQDVKALFKKEKVSLATLIPTAWMWYDTELLEVIDENGDGKPDEKFGTQFKIIYLSAKEDSKDIEQQAILLSKTTIKNINLKYAALKNEQQK